MFIHNYVVEVGLLSWSKHEGHMVLGYQPGNVGKTCKHIDVWPLLLVVNHSARISRKYRWTYYNTIQSVLYVHNIAILVFIIIFCKCSQCTTYVYGYVWWIGGVHTNRRTGRGRNSVVTSGMGQLRPPPDVRAFFIFQQLLTPLTLWKKEQGGSQEEQTSLHPLSCMQSESRGSYVCAWLVWVHCYITGSSVYSERISERHREGSCSHLLLI